ncbi:MAG TPA: PilZ domain-containing protein [Terriglobales bacterium]|nr:PilZ domain-containing protein [Terriglobales bacterium]
MQKSDPTVESGGEDVTRVERRRWPRRTIDVRARVSIKSSGGLTTVCHGRGSDLSECGMAVTIPLELSIGQHVRLVMLLPRSDREIRIEATVRNRKGHRYGMEFTSLCPLDRELIIEQSSHCNTPTPVM